MSTSLSFADNETGSNSIWDIVKSPNPSTVEISNDVLLGVSALSDNSAWAVGTYSSSVDNNVQHTLVEYWNGSAWSIESTASDGELLAVSALSSDDVWAVGDRNGRTLIENYNGSAWSVVRSPNPFAQGDLELDYLSGVATLAPNDVWAVGYYGGENGFGALILHWNGTIWAKFDKGVAAFDGITLSSITAISANNIWAVGDDAGLSTNFEMHFDGQKWTVVPSAILEDGGGQEIIRGVSAFNGSDVWAVGTYIPKEFGVDRTLVIHWNGTAWSQSRTPNEGSSFNEFYSVAIVNASDVWAVGYAYDRAGNFYSLTENWNGSAWTIVQSPHAPHSIGNELRGIVATGPRTVWAVGVFDNHVQGNPGDRTLTMHTTQGNI